MAMITVRCVRHVNNDPKEVRRLHCFDCWDALVQRIEDLEQVWLACDQTLQCAVCGHIEWGDEKGKHPESCAVGRLEQRLLKRGAALNKALDQFDEVDDLGRDVINWGNSDYGNELRKLANAAMSDIRKVLNET